MTRPTREQIEQARAQLLKNLPNSIRHDYPQTADAIDVVIAATAEPTEEAADVEFNDAAIALEMRKVERRGGSTDDMRHAAMAEVQRQLRARIADLEASREPGADVVDAVALVFGRAYRANVGFQEHGQPLNEPTLAGISAILAHLAAMGEEAWPNQEDLCRLAWSVEAPALGITAKWDDIDQRIRDAGLLGSEAVLALMRSRLSPVIGALRARVAGLEGAQ